MNSPISNFKFRIGRRRGSILILVIALLVMLALVGTAFITSTRLDRTAAATGSANTQIDLFGQSVENIAVDAIFNDAFTSGAMQTPQGYVANPAASVVFNPVTSPTTSTFLAARVPTLPPNVPVNPPVIWEYISGPLSGGVFEDPTTLVTWGDATKTGAGNEMGANDRYNVAIGALKINNVYYPALTTSSSAADASKQFIAGDADGDGIADSGLVRLGTLPGAEFAGVTFYYGVRVIDGNSAINASTAWTSGNDGVASSGSAQAGVAGAAGATLRNNRLTPASIGLREMLSNAADMDFPTLANVTTLNLYRFNSVSPDVAADYNLTPNPPHVPYADYDPGDATSSTSLKAYNRSDFKFGSQLDAFWSQLGSRPDFPGYVAGQTVASSGTRYQAPPATDTVSLAYKFCLADPNANSTINSTNPSNAYLTAPSILEQTLHTDLYSFGGAVGAVKVPTKPYDPQNYATWYNENFAYTLTNNPPMPRRALIVSRNPVVNYATSHTPIPNVAVESYQLTVNQGGQEYMTHPNVATSVTSTTTETYVDRGAWQPLTDYKQGDVVTASEYKTPSSGSTNAHSYVCVISHTSASTFTPSTKWREQSWTLGTAKANVNTATFNEMWRAYWNVMVNAGNTPFDPPTDPTNGNAIATPPGVDGTYAYIGNKIAGGNDPYPAMTQHPYRMFRSVLRGPTNANSDPYFSPSDMVLLRSAIAAANAEHMRNFSQSGNINDTIAVHTIALKNSTHFPTNLKADIYATGIQPFITEVYVNQDVETGNNASTPASQTPANTDGYISIELYNPFNYDINLDGWQIMLHDRGATTLTPWAANYTAPGTSPPGAVFAFQPFTGGHILRAHGTVVLENFAAVNPTPNSANHRPPGSNLPAKTDFTQPANATSTTTTFVTVGELSQAIGHELVLLRPRNGTIAGNQLNVNGVAEVPVDSFDFSRFQRGNAMVRTGSPAVASQTSPDAIAYEYYYCRPAGIGYEGQSVYPGYYNGTTGAGVPHQEVLSITWIANHMIPDPMGGTNKIEDPQLDPWTSGVSGIKVNPPAQPGLQVLTTGGNPVDFTATFGYDIGGLPAGFANTSHTSTKVFTIQLGGVGAAAGGAYSGFGGPNGIIAGNGNQAPFGNFMREADLLQIPFIGAYTIYDGSVATLPATTTQSAGLYEINTVSMDAAFADDTDPNDDKEENVGRFCPIVPAYAIPSGGTTTTDIQEFAGKPINMRYGWASRLFDYLTVRGNQHFPDVNPTAYSTVGGIDPQPVPHSTGTAKTNPMIQGNEPPVIEGLININTAPVEVLRWIPWVPMDSKDTVTTDPQYISNAQAANYAIAQAIVAYRDGTYGTDPAGTLDHMGLDGKRRFFHNIFELNKVLAISGTAPSTVTQSFRMNNFYPTGITAPSWGTESTTPETTASFNTAAIKTHDNGDFSPTTAANFNAPFGTNEAATDGVVNDFESQFLQLSAVSNLITTRSDTFTVYVVIEGWTNIGTPQAARVSQRRVAFLVDRTGVTSPNNRNIRVTPISTN